jgi:uracil-DNA glycosylase
MAKQRTLTALRKAAAGCRRCDLWQRGTQTVFGEGPSEGRLMLVGEQPGDREASRACSDLLYKSHAIAASFFRPRSRLS